MYIGKISAVYILLMQEKLGFGLLIAFQRHFLKSFLRLPPFFNLPSLRDNQPLDGDGWHKCTGCI